jgi:hypothetical protein
VGEFDGSTARSAALKDLTSQLIGRFIRAAERPPGAATARAADAVRGGRRRARATPCARSRAEGRRGRLRDDGGGPQPVYASSGDC